MINSSLFQLSITKVRSIFREPEAIFWVIVFPVILSIALGIAFRATGPTPLPVAIQQGEGAAALIRALEDEELIDLVVLEEVAAREALRTGRVAVVVIPGEDWTYWFDPTRPESREARLLTNDLLQRAEGRVDVRATSLKEMTEKGSRYIDFLIPGLLGMNLMGTGMWSIGFSIVNSRQRRILKRFVATPMRRWEYLLAQFMGRLAFLVVEVGVLLAAARFLFGVPMRGAIVTMALVCIVGAFAFASLGLLVAARPKTVEGVSGLMNLVMMPMWILSGTFFSTDRFPEAMQPVVQLLPLTALNNALRAVMIEGATLVELSGDLLVVGGWGFLGFIVAIKIFRWQ
jgi:ABC-type multidrug transport system permease subunit